MVGRFLADCSRCLADLYQMFSRFLALFRAKGKIEKDCRKIGFGHPRKHGKNSPSKSCVIDHACIFVRIRKNAIQKPLPLTLVIPQEYECNKTRQQGNDCSYFCLEATNNSVTVTNFLLCRAGSDFSNVIPLFTDS